MLDFKRGDFIRDTVGNSMVEYAPPGFTDEKPACVMTFTPDGQGRIKPIEWEVATKPFLLEPRKAVTAIQIQAIRECQVATWVLRFINPPDGMRVWAAPYFQSPVHSWWWNRLRVRRLEGPQRVIGVQNLPTGMPPSEIESIDHIDNVTAYPHDFWCFQRFGWGGKNRNQLLLSKGQCLGIVARSNAAVMCIARIAGV